jgi:hypothetical protein
MNLPPNLLALYCQCNFLESLPELPPTLELLHCNDNYLKTLPKLPESLLILNCSYNDLKTIPELPHKLKDIDCRKNPILSLPNLPASLEKIIMNHFLSLPYRFGNVAYQYIPSLNDTIIIRNIVNDFNQKTKQFAFFFYCVKFKHRFRSWLWEKVREKKIQKQYHPNRIHTLLESGIEIDQLEDFL